MIDDKRRDPDDVCMDDYRNFKGYLCTEPHGHKGPHIAEGVPGEICARWERGQGTHPGEDPSNEG